MCACGKLEERKDVCLWNIRGEKGCVPACCGQPRGAVEDRCVAVFKRNIQSRAVHIHNGTSVMTGRSHDIGFIFNVFIL